MICFELGVNAHDIRPRTAGSTIYEQHIPPSLRTLTKDDFDKTLLVLSSLYLYIENYFFGIDSAELKGSNRK